MPLIETEYLEKIYTDDGSQTTALRDVSLKVAEGEFLAVTGPSGSGKSTLLHILGLLDQPSRGRYLFAGKNIEDYSSAELARLRNERIGFVFQQFNLLARTNVLENVKLPLLYSRVNPAQWQQRALRAVRQVNLENRLKHLPSQLSGGEKQRVAIARALVNEPALILADEPTGSLDTQSGRLVMDYLERLNKQGRTLIVITHEIDIARRARRIITLKDGKIDREERGRPE